MRLSKRERVMVFGALAFACIMLFVFYYYFPTLDKIKELTTKQLDISQQLDEKKKMNTLIDTMKDSLAKLQDTTSANKEYLMSNFDQPELLVYINETIGSKSTLNAIQLGSITSNELYVSGDITFDIQTSYEELKKIIDRFEVGKYFSTVTTLSIASQDASQDAEGTDSTESTDGNNSKYPLSASIVLRFYSKDPLWDGQGTYDFIKGDFSKNNIFE